MIYGYSERGIFNSIIYYLDAKPELIGKFLEKLEVEGFTEGKHTFTFLNEQSFSDFGDNDLTIIIDEETENKTVVFIEGKVKTFSGKYCLENEFVKIRDAKEVFKGISSNIFVQLYYKYVLQKVVNSGEKNTEKFVIDDIFKKKNRRGELVERSIGENGVVLEVCKRIEKAKYYYIAILPENINVNPFSEYFEKIDQMKLEVVNINFVYWGIIEKFFENVKPVYQNFVFNKAKDKKGIFQSQIY